MKKCLPLIVLLIYLQNFAIAQTKDLQTTCATTAQNTIGNFTISYTIGEMVLVETWKSNGLTVTQGISQPLIIPVDAGAGNFNPGEITIFPNPTPNDLFVRYNILQPGKLNIQLFDALGQSLLTKEVAIFSFGINKIDFSKFSSATYFISLQYTSADGTINKKGKYKIVKSQ